jgi:hypothetical protein
MKQITLKTVALQKGFPQSSSAVCCCSPRSGAEEPDTILMRAQTSPSNSESHNPKMVRTLLAHSAIRPFKEEPVYE